MRNEVIKEVLSKLAFKEIMRKVSRSCWMFIENYIQGRSKNKI